MKSRIGSLLLASASSLVVVLVASTPVQAVTPMTQTGAGGCTDIANLRVCIGENPQPAIIGTAALDTVYPRETCSITISIFDPGTGANRVTSPAVDCTVSSAFVMEGALVNHTYVACAQGTINNQPVSECSPYQLAHS